VNPKRKPATARTDSRLPHASGRAPGAGRELLPAKVRIIGGRWKRTPLPVAAVPGLRPTPDRIRETLFNWLGQDLTGWRCLDPFAGTGALGFEAASRGAARVVLIEQDSRAVELLRRTRDKLHAEQVDVVQGDALVWLRASAEPFDLVLLDPPFGTAWAQRVLPLLEPLLAPGAWVYVETDAPLTPADPPLATLPWLRLAKADKAGRVHYHLLRHSNGA
jgi:16S rRNA (guanine966-N2)-methyltransferase